MIELLRRCSKCKEHLSIDRFGRKSRRKDGLNLWCKGCVKASIDARRSTIEGRRAHNDRERARGRANPDLATLKAKEWRLANLERAKSSNRAAEKKRRICPVYRVWLGVYRLSWERRNPAKVIAKANRRRSAKLGATPKWLTPIQKAQIKEFYEIAVAREVQTGVRYTVDHIHPLKGINFSGLHVPWNLQIMSHSANSSKANKLPCDVLSAPLPAD